MYYICKFPSYMLCDGGVYIRISDINNFPIGQSLSRHNLLHNLTLIMHHKSIGQNNLMISHCTFFNFTTVWITRFFKKKVFHSVYLSLSVFSPLFPWYWYSRPHQAFRYDFFLNVALFLNDKNKTIFIRNFGFCSIYANLTIFNCFPYGLPSISSHVIGCTLAHINFLFYFLIIIELWSDGSILCKYIF